MLRGLSAKPTPATGATETIVTTVHMRLTKSNRGDDMINIRIVVKRDKKPQITLKQFIRGLIALNQIYGKDSQELNKAVGRYYDKWCRR